MDPNLLYWKDEGQSFVSRLRIWVDLLDPRFLLASDAEVQKAHTRLEKQQKHKLTVNEGRVLNLSLSSVHADSGHVLPLFFRPAAFLPASAPLVIASSLPHTGVFPALFWQFLLQSYSVGFNHANRNSSLEKRHKTSEELLLLMAGTVSFSTCAGALPQIFINRLHIRSAGVQTFFRSIFPVPLSAALAFYNVLSIRRKESKYGIQVFDSDGNPVGFSKAAGQKAVRETALSRAALMGSTAAVPNLLVLLLKRTRFFQRNSLLVGPLHFLSAAVVLGVMIPTSFSLFPQVGTISKENVEEDLKATAVSGHLYYHRGL